MSNTRGWVSPPDDDDPLDTFDDLNENIAADDNMAVASASPGAPTPARRISAGRWALLWLNVALLALCVTLAASNMSLLHLGSAAAPSTPTRSATTATSPNAGSQAINTVAATATDTATPVTYCCASAPTAIPTQSPTQPPAATPTPIPTIVRNN